MATMTEDSDELHDRIKADALAGLTDKLREEISRQSAKYPDTGNMLRCRPAIDARARKLRAICEGDEDSWYAVLGKSFGRVCAASEPDELAEMLVRLAAVSLRFAVSADVDALAWRPWADRQMQPAEDGRVDEIVEELADLGREIADDWSKELNACTGYPVWMIEEQDWERDPWREDGEHFHCDDCEGVRSEFDAVEDPHCRYVCHRCRKEIEPGDWVKPVRRILKPGMMALTRPGGEALLARQAHNCKKPKIYVESMHASPQMRRLRELLMELGGVRESRKGPSDV